MDVERTLEALAERQVIFQRDMEQMRLTQAQHQGMINEVVGILNQFARRTEARFEETDRMLRALAEAQQRTEQKLQEFIENTNRRFSDLAESQQHTDERLNALIKIVDDLIRRDGHRG